MKNLIRLPFVVFGVFALLVASGCNGISKKRDFEPTQARFYLEDTDDNAFASATLPVSGVKIALNNKPIIVEFDIVHVEIARSDMGQFLIFQLTPEAARDLYRFTASNQGRRLVLVINGKPVGARQIDRPFGGGAIAIFTEVPDEALPALVKNLNGTSDEIQKEIANQKS